MIGRFHNCVIQIGHQVLSDWGWGISIAWGRRPDPKQWERLFDHSMGIVIRAEAIQDNAVWPTFWPFKDSAWWMTDAFDSETWTGRRGYWRWWSPFIKWCY